MKKEYPLISVLICCYNNQKYLYDNLKSVFSQTYPNLEVLISDDASESFNGEQLVIWINKNKTNNIKKIAVYENQFNIGEVASLKVIQSKSTGRYLINLSANNVFFDDDVIMHLFKKAKEIGDEALIIVSENEIWDEKLENNIGVALGADGIRKIKKCTVEELFAECCMHEFFPSCYLYHRNLLECIGLLCNKNTLMGDWVTLLKILRNGIKPYYCDVKAIAKLRTNNIKVNSKLVVREWYKIYANEIEPFLDKLSMKQKETVQKNAENKFREYCNLLVDDLKENGQLNNIKIIEKDNSRKVLSYKYKLKKCAYGIFTTKPFFILKKYIKKYGLKELVCKMSSKNSVMINAVISVFLLVGLIFSEFNGFTYSKLTFISLFILWCSITVTCILLHYYLLDR